MPSFEEKLAAMQLHTDDNNERKLLLEQLQDVFGTVAEQFAQTFGQSSGIKPTQAAATAMLAAVLAYIADNNSFGPEVECSQVDSKTYDDQLNLFLTGKIYGTYPQSAVYVGAFVLSARIIQFWAIPVPKNGFPRGG